MKILVDRKWRKDTYTIGKLYVDDEPFCETLEDKDRGLVSTMPLEKVKAAKVYGETAIPTGTYNVRMDVTSNKFSKYDWYQKNCHGAKLPRLVNVPGYEGILIHPGNTDADTGGCILVGQNKVKGKVINSKETFLKLYNLMYAAYQKGEKITITIK